MDERSDLSMISEITPDGNEMETRLTITLFPGFVDYFKNVKQIFKNTENKQGNLQALVPSREATNSR